MGKRKNIEKLQRKIKKLRRKIETEAVRDSPSPNSDLDSLEDLFAENVENKENQDIVEQAEIPTDQEQISINEQIQPPEQLDEEILQILGEGPEEKNKPGPPIHASLATRWSDLIVHGLNKDVKSNLMKKYLTPNNCQNINAPKLNLEIKAAISENVAKKDKILEIKQKQIATAIAALGECITTLIKKGEHEALRAASDAARLLCDQQYYESLTRKHLILAVLNKTTKDAIQGVKTDEWLFGENLTERIKASKIVSRSAQELKNKAYRPFPRTQASTSQPTSSLNWRGPNHTPQFRPQARGGLRPPGPRPAQPPRYRGHNYRR